MDRALELVGNVVSIHGVDIESTGGVAAGYFIKLGRTGVMAGANIRLYDTVIECSTGHDKKHLLLQNTQDVWIENYWAESAGANSMLWDLSHAVRTHATGFILGPGGGATLNLNNSSSLYFAGEFFTAGRGIDSAITCDASSFFEIGTAWNGAGDNAIVLPDYDYKLHAHVRVNRSIAENPTAYPHYAARLLQQNIQGENLFQNPNFLAGEMGWDFGGSATFSRSYVKSAFGLGRACKLTFTTGGYATATQRITLVAGDDGSGLAKYAGQAITVAMRVRFISSSGGEWGFPIFSGIRRGHQPEQCDRPRLRRRRYGTGRRPDGSHPGGNGGAHHNRPRNMGDERNGYYERGDWQSAMRRWRSRGDCGGVATND